MPSAASFTLRVPSSENRSLGSFFISISDLIFYIQSATTNPAMLGGQLPESALICLVFNNVEAELHIPAFNLPRNIHDLESYTNGVS